MAETTGQCPQLGTVTADAVLELLSKLTEEDRQIVLTKSAENSTAAEASEEAGIGWTEVFVLCGGFALMFYVFFVVMWEIKRYSSIPSSKEKTVSDFLKYRFGAWYSKTPGAASIVLFYLSVALLVVGGVFYRILTDQADASIADSLWAAWIWIVAPDGGGSAEGYYGRIAGLFVSCGGMLIFAMLMSIISAKFEEMLDMFKNEGLPVVEGGHIAILGWSPMVPFLVGELCTAKEGSGGSIIVILTPLEKVAVEEMLEESGVDFKNSEVVVRSGDRWKTEDLEHIALNAASIVIVVSRQDVTREDSDARQLNVLSAMKTKKWPTDGAVLVQCMLHTNKNVFSHYCHSERKDIMVTGDLLGSLMVNCTKQRGLAQATLGALGFEGSEFYTLKVAGIAGKTFREVVFGLPGAVAMGISRGDKLELLPKLDTKLTGDERIIMLAEDETTCPTQLDEKLIKSALALSVGTTVKPLQNQTPTTQEGETVVVIGWNETVGVVLNQLDKALPMGSKVVIFAPASTEDREAFVRAALKRRGKEKYSSFDIEHVAGPLCARSQLLTLPLKTATKIFILADSSSSNPRVADGSSVAVSLQVLDITRESKNPNQVIVPQLLLSSTVEHFQSMGLPDFILSDSLVASICAQVSCNQEMRGLIEELLSEEGCQFCIRTLEEYPELPGESDKSKVTFAKIAARAVLAGEVALGFKLSFSAYEEWSLNPTDHSSALEWAEESRIVSLSRTSEGS